MKILKIMGNGELIKNSNFKLLYSGQVISNAGDKIYNIALMWLVFEMTNSTFYTGLTVFLIQIPGVFTFLFGPIIDKASLRKLLSLVEFLQAVIVAIIPIIIVVGVIDIHLILTVVFILGLLKNFSGAVQATIIPEVILESNLARGNSIISASNQAVGSIAQGISGLLITLVGSVALFIINFITFIISAAMFSLISYKGSRKPINTDISLDSSKITNHISNISESFAIYRNSTIAYIVTGTALTNLFIGMTTSVLPEFADSIGTAATYGLLVMSISVGAFFGATIATTLENTPLGKVIICTFAVSAVCWASALIFVPHLGILLLLFALSFAPTGIYNVLMNTGIQTGVPKSILGRITSISGSLISLTGPVGLLFGGYTGDIIGARSVMILSAIGFFSISVYWLSIPSLRRFPAVNATNARTFNMEEYKDKSSKTGES